MSSPETFLSDPIEYIYIYISISLPEDGNRSSFRNVVFSSYLEQRATAKAVKSGDRENFFSHFLIGDGLMFGFIRQCCRRMKSFFSTLHAGLFSQVDSYLQTRVHKQEPPPNMSRCCEFKRMPTLQIGMMLMINSQA
jgi:hypothetical protein